MKRTAAFQQASARALGRAAELRSQGRHEQAGNLERVVWYWTGVLDFEHFGVPTSA